MVNVDDIHGVSSWYSSAMGRLKEVGNNNQELILQFLSRLQKQGATLNTRADRLNLLIRMDKYFKKPLNEIAEKDFDFFLVTLMPRDILRGMWAIIKRHIRSSAD